MDWTACKIKKLAKEIKIDKNLINSLIKTADNKLKTQDSIKLSDNTAISKISLSYDSLRELLEALAIFNGYKIYNHECYTSFLKEILNESNLGDSFDKMRMIRNDINYYGKDVGKDEAEKILEIMKNLINKVKQKLQL